MIFKYYNLLKPSKQKSVNKQNRQLQKSKHTKNALFTNFAYYVNINVKNNVKNGAEMNKNDNQDKAVAFRIKLPTDREKRKDAIREIQVTLYSLLYYSSYQTSTISDDKKRKILEEKENFTLEEMVEYLREYNEVSEGRLQDRINQVMNELETLKHKDNLRQRILANKSIAALSWFFRQDIGKKLFFEILEKGVRLNIEDAVWEAITNPDYLNTVHKKYINNWVKLYEQYYGKEKTL